MADKKKKQTPSAKNITGGAALAAGAAATGLAAYEADSEARRKRKVKNKRQQTRQAAAKKRTTNINAGKTRVAQQQLKNLERINSKDLSAKDRKIKQELIKRQKDIIKGAKPNTLAKTAAKLGLRSIPGVGAFIGMFSSKPAGQGSARFGPGSGKN